MNDIIRRLTSTDAVQCNGPKGDDKAPWLPRLVIDKDGNEVEVAGVEGVNPVDNPWVHGGSTFRKSGKKIVPAGSSHSHFAAEVAGGPLKSQPCDDQEEESAEADPSSQEVSCGVLLTSGVAVLQLVFAGACRGPAGGPDRGC